MAQTSIALKRCHQTGRNKPKRKKKKGFLYSKAVKQSFLSIFTLKFWMYLHLYFSSCCPFVIQSHSLVYKTSWRASRAAEPPGVPGKALKASVGQSGAVLTEPQPPGAWLDCCSIALHTAIMSFLSHPKNLDRHQFGQKAKGSAPTLLPNKEDVKHVAAKEHVLGSKKGQLGFYIGGRTRGTATSQTTQNLGIIFFFPTVLF